MNQQYTLYDKATGRIIQHMICPEKFIQDQCSDLICYLEGHIDGNEFYVIDGVAISKPPKPSEFHEFDYTTKQWVDLRTPETQWFEVRAERDRLLIASDWTQLPDVPLATKTAWAEYRQALRDVTLQPDPFTIIWPAKPE